MIPHMRCITHNAPGRPASKGERLNGLFKKLQRSRFLSGVVREHSFEERILKFLEQDVPQRWDEMKSYVTDDRFYRTCEATHTRHNPFRKPLRLLLQRLPQILQPQDWRNDAQRKNRTSEVGDCYLPYIH